MRIDGRLTKLENRVTPPTGTIRLVIVRFVGESGDGSLFRDLAGNVYTEQELDGLATKPGEHLICEQVLSPAQVAELGLR